MKNKIWMGYFVSPFLCPKLIKLAALVFLSISFLSFTKMKTQECRCDCEYSGSIRRVLLGDKKHTFSSMQLGEYYHLIDVQHCKILNGDTIELSGKIAHRNTQDNGYHGIADVAIEKCIRKNGFLVKGEILTISDRSGFFSLKTKLEPSAFIIIHQTSQFAMCYEMSGFTKVAADK